MAVVTRVRRAKHRQNLSLSYPRVTWTKNEADSALQAIVDLLQKQSTRNAINNAVETAAAGKFNGVQKKKMFAIAVSEVFEQENN